MILSIHDWPEFVEAPSQGSPWVVWNLPEHLAKMLATLGPTDDGQIAEKSARFLRLWQWQKLFPLPNVDVAQHLNG
ncbi:hypothetical protein EV281_11264 [Rhizobium sp. BK418]|nr:hypothetical protein EV281_11264 [Rhizobium sp. BK418]